jgi:hypothetical protein
VNFEFSSVSSHCSPCRQVFISQVFSADATARSCGLSEGDSAGEIIALTLQSQLRAARGAARYSALSSAWPRMWSQPKSGVARTQKSPQMISHFPEIAARS